MKSIKDLRENYNLITEKEEHDMNKLTQLVRAGLFDAKKLSALKRAMDKPADKMTAQEKRMMINLLDALMAEVLSDKQVYRKIKQDVMKEAKNWDAKDYLVKDDPRIPRNFPTTKEVPSVVLLKRKGIRVFPDGHKIALYYAQAIDKYVSIPFSDIGINEEIHLEEGKVWDAIKSIGKGIANAVSSSANSSSSSSGSSSSEPKYTTVKEPSLRAKVVDPSYSKTDDDSPAVASKMRQQYRKSLQQTNESASDRFRARLDEKREYGAVDLAADTASFTPGPIGSAASLASAGLSLSRGDYFGAALDAAGAFPIVGYAAKAAKVARAATKATKAATDVDKFLDVAKTIKPPTSTASKATDVAVPKALEAPKNVTKSTTDVAKPTTSTSTAVSKEVKPRAATEVDKFLDTASKIKPKTRLKGRALQKVARGLGMAAALGGAAGGSKSSDKSSKPLTPMDPKLKANLADPKYHGTDDAVQSYERRLFRKSISENTEVSLDGNVFDLNNRAAQKVTALYESLNKKNKKKMVEMMNESAESLEKVISFAVRQ